MTAPRIGKQELARPTPAQTTHGKSAARLLSRSLTSPFGILLVFPSIVLLVGVFLALVGQRALKVSNVTLGERRLAEQAQLVAAHLDEALSAADPMLDRLADFALSHDSSEPPEATAAVLLDLMQGRAGVAYASLSFPDGTFRGSYVDKDGALRFQESRVAPNGTVVRRYEYQGHATLRQLTQEATDYDPRRRDFYAQAAAQRKRIWTQPYPFYDSHYTGITRAAPVYRQVQGASQLHAVLTIDFDVNALSRLLRKNELKDVRTLLYTQRGTLLAYPQAEARIRQLPLGDQVLSYRDLHDATLDSFFGAVQGQPHGAAGTFGFELAGESYLAAVAQVSSNPELGWSVAYVVPERVFFDSLHTYGRRSFAIASVAVLLALGVSVAFARLIVKARRDVAQARAEAKQANLAARELGSYRLAKCLGKGGMGEVWRAEHRLLARQAAIKLIRLDNGAPSSADAQERFRREAETLAALCSRNTIELFDYGVADDGTFFYVMELLDGLDLESLVVRFGAQPPGRVVRLLAQACRSLAEAHDAGLVHRDIKPANLFICRAADEVDLIKVLDFGLVRALAGQEPDAPPLSTQAVWETTAAAGAITPDAKLTRAGSVMGTPEFMAPEQALGHKLDGRADLYALGCVGYWLLTGHVPFHKDTAMMLLIAHINEPAVPVHERAPGGVPSAIARCIMDCMAKSPDHRPQTARELLKRLAEAEQALPPADVWSDERAATWWAQNLPPARRSSSAPSPESPPVTEIVHAKLN